MRLLHRLSGGWEQLLGLAQWPVFSRTSYRVVRALSRQGVLPTTVIDVGANIGQFSVAAHNILRPKAIHAFEPLPQAFTLLARNCARYTGVTVYNIALGASETQARLRVNSHTQSSSLLPLGERHRRAFPSAREVGDVEVQVQRLDTVLSPDDLAGPVLLKIDAQGYEPQVLDGTESIRDSLDYILLEASFSPLYEGESSFLELVRHIQYMGFRFLRPVDFLADSATGEYLQMDALFCRAHG